MPRANTQEGPAASTRLVADLAAKCTLANTAGSAEHDAARSIACRLAEPRRHLRERERAANEYRSARVQAGQAALVKRFGLPIRRHAEQALQSLAQVGVPAQSRSAVATLELALHQCAVSGLVGGFDLGQLLPLGAGTQAIDIAVTQTLADRFAPSLIARAGQQVTGIAARRFGAVGDIASGQRRVGRALECLGIDDDFPVRPEHDLCTLPTDGVMAPQGLARVVHCLAQVGRAGLGAELRPKCVDDLVADQPAPRLHAQQLHEVRRSQAGPALGRQVGRTDVHRKTAEQVNVQRRRRVAGRMENRKVHGASLRSASKVHKGSGGQERLRNAAPASSGHAGSAGATELSKEKPWTVEN